MKKIVKKVTKAKAVKTAKAVKAVKKVRKVVMFSRLGQDPVAITVAGSSTVGLVLRKAEIVVSGSEHVWVNGTRAGISKRVKPGDIISIVSPRQAGV